MRLFVLFATCAAIAAAGVNWGKIPLSFEPNQGQANADVHYLSAGGSSTVYFASGEVVIAAPNQPTLRTKFSGANLSAPIAGEGKQPSTSNYFIGSDPNQWRTVSNFGTVRYTGIYPGIDLVYYGKDGTLEYDWIVSAGADPRNIRMVFDGTARPRIDKQGDLIVASYRHKKPTIYQEVCGKRVQIAGSWTLHGNEGSFRVGAYDRTKALIIDPPLIYSTYHGGSSLDYAYAVTVDGAGNTYVAGNVGSSNFPTAGGLQNNLRGSVDAFVTKFSADGSARLYSTYLGGGGVDQANGIAVDSQGNAYVTGIAGSSDFPLKNPIQSKWGGSGDAFLAKLNPTGSALVYSTFLGGLGMDYGTAVAVDLVGGAYIVGVTFSSDFPTVNPFQAAKGAQQDAFVARINPSGTAWVYATYLGGNAVDEAYAIALDSNGSAYVTGYTGSSNFPLQSAFRGSNTNSVDAFVTAINAAGSALLFSTYLGGSATDYGTGIAVDSSGVYVAGIVSSNDFPVVNPMQPKFGGGDDVFVTKFDPSGHSLLYSTYLGGGSVDDAYALAIDQSGNAYVTGRTNSTDFPLTNALQATRFAFDMFVTELNASGSGRIFSTFLGGTGSESGRGIAIDRAGNIHIAGETTSIDFPVKNAIQGQNGGGGVPQDAFVLLLGDHPPPAAPLSITKSHTGNFSPGQLGVYSVTVSNPAATPSASETVTVTESVPAGETLVSMAGIGWTCATAACTRSDVLSPGSSYPAIAVIVSVSSTAPTSVANQVVLSVAGSAIAGASDLTQIAPANNHPAFFTGEVLQTDGSYTLQFADGNLFGAYNYLSPSTFHHADLGTEALIAGTADDIYLYDQTSAHWFYTSATLFPYLYDFTLNAWLYYFPDSNRAGHYTTNPRTFSNLTTGTIFTM